MCIANKGEINQMNNILLLLANVFATIIAAITLVQLKADTLATDEGYQRKHKYTLLKNSFIILLTISWVAAFFLWA